MKKNFNELMEEYAQVKEYAVRFEQWYQLDKFVEKLITELSMKSDTSSRKDFQKYSFDANGSAVHEE